MQTSEFIGEGIGEAQVLGERPGREDYFWSSVISMGLSAMAHRLRLGPRPVSKYPRAKNGF